MADCEIYPKTALALVVAELRHPAALPLQLDSARAQLKTRLAPLFPLAKPVQMMSMMPGQAHRLRWRPLHDARPDLLGDIQGRRDRRGDH